MVRVSYRDGHLNWTSRLARIGQPVAICLFVAAIVLTAWNLIATSADRGNISTQNRVTLALEQLLSAVRDIETGSRGYVLVGRDEYLGPYRAAQAALDGIEGSTKSAWIASGRRTEELDALFAMIEQKRRLAASLVSTQQASGFAAAQALISQGEGKATMDAIRASIAGLQTEAGGTIDRLERRDRVRSIVLTSAAVLAAVLGAVYFGWLAWYRRQQVYSKAEELAGLGDRFRTLADNIPQLVWMADATGRIYWYNQQWYDFTGLTTADMEGDGWRKVHAPDMVEGVTQRFFEAISAGIGWEDTFPLRGKDGEYRWFLSLAQPIRNAKGEVVRWFGTNTDITEQRMQGQELATARDVAEEANRAKSQFLANMSHELRTPLSAVIGYSEMLEDEAEETGQQHLLEDLSKIKSNARHLLSLINDVLDISKIEANKMEVYSETFDVAEMLQDVAATVGSLMEKKQNRFAVDLPDDLGSMHSDVVKIRQVLINLLSNAAKFTEAGEIRLTARRLSDGDGDRVAFNVRDTGLGMTDEQVAKLFERFTQADISTTRRFGGTGLGLAITKAFADMLGGKISISSKPDVGSEFEIVFPTVAPVHDAETVETPAHTDPQKAVEEDVVLVIDDDPAARDLLTRFLSKEGFSVRTAEDGRAGLRLAELLKPRVILLDVTMPRMDGWTVLRSLKDNPQLAAIPVVMCTIIDEQNLGFSLGASDYVMKPVNWEKLREVLARVQKDADKGNVLIVEDDDDTRKRVGGLLAKNGWTVAEAVNGQAALVEVERQLPSVVLLDLNMPEMDGFTFLRRFRANPEWAAVPVVVMTARDLSPGERAELSGNGARVLEKGAVRMQDLVDQLRVIAPQRAQARPPAIVPAG
jgi:PAS domain S-box-containing protein